VSDARASAKARGAGSPAAAALTAALAIGGEASAHLVSSDLGPFYDGAAHPLVSPEDTLAILGLALVAARGGPAAGRAVLGGVTAGWMIGVVAGFLAADSTWSAPTGSAIALLVLGSLAAAWRRLPVAVLATLLTGGAVALERRGASMVLRVAGSWIAAAGLLMLGWALRPIGGA